MAGQAEVTPRRRSPLWLLWLGSWLLLLCTAHGNLESLDSSFTINAARALWLRGDSGLLRSDDGAEWEAEAAAADHIAENSVFGRTGQDGRHQYVWFPMGHVWLMVPAVALGEWLQRAFPAVEGRYRARAGPVYREGQFVFDQGMVALLLPSLFGATTIVLLFLIARALGSSSRQALLVAASIALATQCFPLLRETLSDGPGLTFLLAALLATLRCALGTATPLAMALGGFAAGAAVLTRYQHAFPVVALAVAVALAARRLQRPRLLLWFCLGSAPCAALLFLVNTARFGDPMTTGYLSAATWFDYPPWLGLPLILVAAGKGILWFSPLLWLLPVMARARHVARLLWLAWALLAIPLLMFSCTNGWQSGQCWGVRYVTAGVVACLALVLPQARPWQRWPRAFALLVGLGVLVNVTSLLAPTRGHNQLAGQAVDAYYEQAFARGEITREDLDSVHADRAARFFTLPRWSPLHSHWTYAWQSCRGGFEHADGRPRDGAEHTIVPLFSVHSDDPKQGLAPIHWEDRGCRHLWPVFWGALLAVPAWALWLPPFAAAVAMLWASWRRMSRD